MRHGDAAGSIVMVGASGLVVSLVLLVVALDVAAYLTAASRAQSLADAAALAAVTASHPHGEGGIPSQEAARVTSAGDGRVETCACPAGAEQVRVAVSVEVPAMALTRYAARRATAEAHARLVPPDPRSEG